MWPRRSQDKSATSSAPQRHSVPPALPSNAPSAALAQRRAAEIDDDCGWLMRAHAKAKSKKPKDNTTVSSASLSKKRPLDANASAKPKTKAPKLPLGIGWSQPKKPLVKPTIVAVEQATTPSGESFDDVYAEVFDTRKHTQSRPVDDDTPSLPINTSVFLPEASDSPTSPIKQRAESCVAKASEGKRALEASSTQWEFVAAAPIELDAFAAPAPVPDRSNSETTTADGTVAFARWKDDMSSHTVSDNFVRLNMRKRVKGSTGKAKKRPEYLRSRAVPDAVAKTKTETTTPSDSTTIGSGSLLDDGVDFIEECLEMLQRHEAAMAEQPSAPVPPAPPRCHHSLVSSRVLVKKKNKNHGRAFFSCPLGYDEGRCDFFLWEDNHTQFALHHLFSPPPQDGSETTASQPSPLAANLVPLDLSRPLAKQAKAMLTNLRVVFGHSDFRAGQQWAIERVLAQKRTLLVLPTGAGKSLCYQYPALFLPGITIVISPLVSLMNDQFHNLPPVLQAQATCVTAANSSKTQYAEFVRDLLGGRLKLLFVSPEKALTSGFQRLLMQMQSRISLVCVDEAHCISEWSHHFRPSYLRLQSIFSLADSVLAITATASRVVEKDIMAQLHGEKPSLPFQGSVLRMPWQRDNLRLHVVQVASDDERLERLCTVLTKTTITGAIIMYVHQQWQAEAMANLLQERLVLDGNASAVNKWTKAKIGYYHAKMDADAKEKVRLGFLNGRVKLVIATIAFGMGIDKQNVRLVIHYHVPSSIEHYLQQVGRAGRDGRAASALLFLLNDDVRAFRSLLYSNALHVSQVHRLVEVVVRGPGCVRFDGTTSRGMVQLMASSPSMQRQWMRVEWLEQYLDMKAATIETFLTLLSLHRDVQQDVALAIHPTAMSWCAMSLTQTQLKSATADPLMKQLVATVMADDEHKLGHVDVDIDGYHQHLTVYFHVAALAQVIFQASARSTMAANDPTIDVQARRLMQSVRAWQSGGQIRKYRMEFAAFDIALAWQSAREDSEQARHQDAQRIARWTELLYSKHQALEAMELDRLKHLHSALSSSAQPSATVLDQLQGSSDSDADSSDATQILEHKLTSYFEASPSMEGSGAQHVSTPPPRAEQSENARVDADAETTRAWRALTTPLTPDLIESIERDVDVLTSRPPHAVIQDDGDDDGARVAVPIAGASTWHGYDVARIFHGLASPCFPSKVWRDQLWWRKYSHVAFEQLVVIADRMLSPSDGAEDSNNSVVAKTE